MAITTQTPTIDYDHMPISMIQVCEIIKYKYFDILILPSPKEHDRWKYSDGDRPGRQTVVIPRQGLFYNRSPFLMYNAIIVSL